MAIQQLGQERVVTSLDRRAATSVRILSPTSAVFAAGAHTCHDGRCVQVGYSSLLLAAMTGADKVVNDLLEHGADHSLPDKVGESLHRLSGRAHACVSVYVRAASTRVFLAHLPTVPNGPPQDGYTPLMRAAQFGNEASVKVLLKSGAMASAVNKVRATPRVCGVLILWPENVRHSTPSSTMR